MREKILFTLLARNNEKYIPYLTKCFDLVENFKENNVYEFEYLVMTNDNTDKTLEYLEEDKRIKIINLKLEKKILNETRLIRLAYLRQKLLEESRKIKFDYLIMLDTDIFFNGNVINSGIKKIKEKKLDILGMNTLSYPFPWFYDFLPFTYENKTHDPFKITKVGLKFLLPYEKIIQPESYYGGLMIFKKDVIYNNKINYETKEDICEHLKLNNKISSQGYKISVINNITPIFEGIYSYNDKEKKSYEKIYNLVKKQKKDLRWSVPVSNYLFYSIFMITLFFVVYKLL